MLSNSSDIEGTAKRRTWFLRRVALPLLLSLLALGFVGMSTGMASPSTPLRPPPSFQGKMRTLPLP